MLNYNIIKKIKVTEKTSQDLYVKENVDHCRKYTFIVNKKNKKPEIESFIEKFYNVKVSKVNILNQKGTERVFRKTKGRTSDQKKAIVTLEKGYKLDIEVANVT